MKKLLFIAVIALSLISCAYSPMDNSKPIVITEIERINKCFCDYYGNGNYSMSMAMRYQFCFRDTVGKFQIGDTINFVKK